MKKKLVANLLAGLFFLGIVGTVGAAPITFYTNKLLFDTDISTTLIEDFESITPKDTYFETITNNGITYTGFAGVPFPNIIVASPGYENFGAGVAQPTTTSILTANGDEDILVNFSIPVEAVGFDVYYNGLGPVSVEVFGSSGLLDIFNVTPGTPSPDYMGYLGILSSGEPITSFRWFSTDGAILNTGIDNLSIRAVPIPTTFWLLGAGIAGIIGLQRKKN